MHAGQYYPHVMDEETRARWCGTVTGMGQSQVQTPSVWSSQHALQWIDMRVPWSSGTAWESHPQNIASMKNAK